MENEAKLNELLGKYEAIMVIAKEARRINNRLRGQNVDFQVTTLAIDRFIDGNVKFEYWEAPEPAEVSFDALEGLSHSATASGLPGVIEAAAEEAEVAPPVVAEEELIGSDPPVAEGAEVKVDGSPSTSE
jgi:hypothetical protein